ncbi:MAG TPA: hypothetical protein ENK73_00775 [Thiomicrospira sp.]|nr:hypothetical protein [Thiomicrospira sp.]
MVKIQHLKKCCSIILFQAGLLVSGQASALTFGIFPVYQPIQLAELNAPLVNFLNKSLSEPVYFRTTTNFGSFNKRAKQQSYDILMIAPNLGYQLSVNKTYTPVLRAAYRPQAVFVVPKTSKITSFSDLKHKAIAFAPDLAITTKVAYKKLADIGIQKGQYQIDNRKSHLESFRVLQLNKADAAAFSLSVWQALPENEKADFRVIGLSDSTPGIFLMVKDAKRYEPVKKALLDFEKTPQGQAYFKASKLIGYKPVTDQDLFEIKSLYQ